MKKYKRTKHRTLRKLRGFLLPPKANIIFTIVGILLVAALLIYAYISYDSAKDVILEDTYTYEVTEDTTEEGQDDALMEESNSESESLDVEEIDPYDFTVENMDGNLIKRSEITGKPMVVHFWASWCGYCDYELPALQTVYEVYGDKVEFMIVCITDGEYETVESAKEYLADKGYTFPIYFDVELEALHGYQLYNLSGVSRTYLFDINGAYVSKANKMVTVEILEEGIHMILPPEFE